MAPTLTLTALTHFTHPHCESLRDFIYTFEPYNMVSVSQDRFFSKLIKDDMKLTNIAHEEFNVQSTSFDQTIIMTSLANSTQVNKQQLSVQHLLTILQTRTSELETNSSILRENLQSLGTTSRQVAKKVDLTEDQSDELQGSYSLLHDRTAIILDRLVSINRFRILSTCWRLLPLASSGTM